MVGIELPSYTYIHKLTMTMRTFHFSEMEFAVKNIAALSSTVKDSTSGLNSWSVPMKVEPWLMLTHLGLLLLSGHCSGLVALVASEDRQ